MEKRIFLTFLVLLLSGNGANSESCPNQGGIRLTNGVYGNVQICYNNTWGLVCDHDWDLKDGNVVCSELQYQRALSVSYSSHYDPGSTNDRIWMDNVNCNGNENRLQDCPFKGWGVHDCNHGDAAGVRCKGIITSPQSYDVRIQGGSNSGQVEVYHNTHWAPVCMEDWSRSFGTVVCRQTSFMAYFNSNPSNTPTSGFHLTGLVCSGAEQNLLGCNMTNVGSVNKTCHNVILTCATSSSSYFIGNDVDIIEGNTKWDGIVRILHQKTWGPLCVNGSWTQTAAQAVCYQLGYSVGVANLSTSIEVPGGGNTVWTANVSCDGWEGSIGACNGAQWTNASHKYCSSYAAVICSDSPKALRVRLSGGSQPGEGRVEIYFGESWGTVCDDGWSISSADVVCRQLGYMYATEAAVTLTGDSPQFGEGSGSIWMNEVHCAGNESFLSNCPFAGWGVHNCDHGEDAGVVCGNTSTAAPPVLMVRLGNSNGTYSGRVEVKRDNETWGTVCDDGWDLTDAEVICQQLFSTNAIAAYSLAHFGPAPNSVPILLDEVSCSPGMVSLSQCVSNEFGVHDCTHGEDASVSCSSGCASRLNSSTHQYEWEGLVEVNHEGVWRPVCDDEWDKNDGHVVCRQLGYPGGSLAVRIQQYTGGTRDFSLSELQCTGDEESLCLCLAKRENIDCYPYEGVFVACAFKNPIQVRLIGDRVPWVGRVEAKLNGIPGRLCSQGWTDNNYKTLCRQLGYNGLVSIVDDGNSRYTRYIGRSGPYWLSGLACTGNKSNLFDCARGDYKVADCSGGYGVTVFCDPGSKAPSFNPIKLVGGESIYDGRLEILYKGVWGTICRDSWSRVNSIVACRELGFGPPLGHLVDVNSDKVGLILLDAVNCSGNEAKLSECPSQGWNEHNCDHTKDIRINCSALNRPGLKVSLSSAPTPNSGQLLVNYSGIVGVVCGDGWSHSSANVACRQLGYGGVESHGTEPNTSWTGSESTWYWVQSIQCDGSEDSLADCSVSVLGSYSECTSNTIASVTCSVGASLRLVGGASPAEGILQIFIEGFWGTVCRRGWGRKSADVACRLLGYTRSIETVDSFKYLSSEIGSSPIWLDDVKCNGDERSLLDCPHGPIGTHACGHSTDIGLMCTSVPSYPVRLVSNTGNTSNGVVQIYHGNTWGSICNATQFTPNDARVVCSSLGFTLGPDCSSGTCSSNTHTSASLVPVWSSSMNCDGSSVSVSNCGVVFGTHFCFHHTLDVNVHCISYNYPVRLSEGLNSSEGRLEVFVSSRWTSVCHKNFDSNDAHVICSQLGYKGVEEIVEERVFGSDGDFLLNDVECVGTEASLSQCAFKVNTVDGFEDCTAVGIRCTTWSPNGDSSIRLVGGAGAGRLEVYSEDSWGSVCNLDWSVEDSKTVCRDLGYSVDPNPIAVDYRSFGRGGGPIKVSRISCKGNESHFSDCVNTSDVSGCGHDNDVAVVCQGSESCTDSSLRLVGGANDLIGRLEMCYRGHWGTVCGDSTGSSSSSVASVACRQLGYSPSGGRVLPYDEFYEKRQGLIWLGGVSCRGNESRLIDCSHLPVGSLSDGCSGHFQDVVLQCQASTEFKIRVRGTQNSFITSGRGRVEVQYNGVWGTVCDTEWDLHAATVVCREMGWGRAVRPSFGSEFGQAWGPIWMDFVRCNGDETSLEKCGHTGWGLVSSCTHSNDAGVVCTNSTVAASISVQISGSIVSVQYNGEWGLVCYDGWDYNDATVVCKELGYKSVYSIGSSSHRPNVSSNPPTVWLSKIHCQGNESSLSQCVYGWGSFNCSSHQGYATLSCSNSDPSSLPIAATLTNGTTSSNGVINIRYGGVWGRVCSSHWTIRDANIVCRGLGYSRARGLKILDVSYSNSDPIWMDNVQCIGNENHLQDCYFDGWGHHTHQITCKSMFVSCKNENFDLKLYNHQNDNSGLLEIYYSGRWGFVCDSDWSLHNSHVACRQLGFGSAESSYTLSSPPVRGLVLMDVVNCTGAESRLVDCPFKGWGYTQANCNESHYVGIVCSNHGNSDMNVRLVGSDSETRGLMQVQYSGRWGYVCGNYWGDFEAKVICNQLGLYPPPVGYSPVSFTAYRPEPSDTVWLDNVQCSGEEERFSECHHDKIGTHSCSISSLVAAVDCSYKNPNQYSVRLVGGASPNEGRVQVYYNGWKSVCGSGWDFRDARVVCRQLGYGDALNVPTSSLYGIRGRDELSVMNDVQCSGQESLLKNCEHTFGNLECSVTNVASALCTDVSHPVVTKVRLVPSSSSSTGTVQVQYNGSWGTVCSNGWDINDAHVVCRQLGYPSAVRTGLSVLFSLPPVSDIPVWLSGVNCQGSESSVGQCFIERGWGDAGSGCTHSSDVAMECTEPKSSNLSVRVISSGVPYKGRIQVLMNGTWAGVCGDKFRATSGNVVCKQLGYSRSLIAFNGSEHYSSFLPNELVLLTGLNCIGTEGSLIDCPTTASTLISEGECQVGPANVICDVTPQVPTPPRSTRLIDVSLSRYKGRLFVYDGSTWGTVCDDFIKPVFGKVLCRSIGYAGPSQIFGRSAQLYLNEFSITDPIHLDDVECNGYERSVFDCPHTTDTAGCEHAEDVSIECSSIRLDSVRARLTDFRSGIVEVLYGDLWSYVCVTDNDWSMREANVVCRELGYTGASSAYTTNEYEVQPGALIDGVNCTGDESRLSYCIINEWNVTKDCPSFAGVVCTVTMDSVRLVGGVSSNEGRVEVLHDGVWSSVCDEGWGLPDAEVICRVLGYPRASRTLAGSWFGKGEGAVWSGVDCIGNEASLSFCPNITGSIGSSCSSHSNDASVICSTRSSVSQDFLCADGDIRLTNNGTILKGQSQGRLEICVGGEWGRVCFGGWGYEEDALVCRQLGFRVEGASRVSSTQFGFGYRPILIDTLQCTGLESSLLQCDHTLLAPGTYYQSCDSTQDVSVSCQTAVSSPVQIRLVGGDVEWAGRVEIHLQDNVIWGRVCDNGWSLASARVVCRQLGYEYAIGATIGTTFGTGSRLLGYSRVTCVGLESGLSNCRTYHKNHTLCDISHVAGAVCSDTPTPPNVRLRLLSNGNKPEGILQVYFAERWGSVCTISGWSLTTADIACHHLGEGLAVSTMGVATSSQDSFWLSGVRCFGNETRLQECQHLGWGYAEEECYEGSTTVWLNCSGNSNTQTSTSIPTITATPSVGPAGESGASSLPVLAVISPTIAAILLFTCLIIVSILFYINHRRHKGRMYRISSPDEGREVQERGIPKKRKKNVITSASQASQLHLLSTEAMSPPMSPSYSKSSSLTRSEQRLDVSMMTITSELINSTAHNGSTSPETTDYNSPPFSPTRIESTVPATPSPTAANNDNIAITLEPNLNSSTRSNDPLTLDPALHTPSLTTTSLSTYNKPPQPSSSPSSSRYADLDVLSSQHNAAKRASIISSSGSNSRAQYATIQEVKPRKISVNTETTTV